MRVCRLGDFLRTLILSSRRNLYIFLSSSCPSAAHFNLIWVDFLFFFMSRAATVVYQGAIDGFEGTLQINLLIPMVLFILFVWQRVQVPSVSKQHIAVTTDQLHFEEIKQWIQFKFRHFRALAICCTALPYFFTNSFLKRYEFLSFFVMN